MKNLQGRAYFNTEVINYAFISPHSRRESVVDTSSVKTLLIDFRFSQVYIGLDILKGIAQDTEHELNSYKFHCLNISLGKCLRVTVINMRSKGFTIVFNKKDQHARFYKNSLSNCLNISLGKCLRVTVIIMRSKGFTFVFKKEIDMHLYIKSSCLIVF